jgi:hypothetical membrane protein
MSDTALVQPEIPDAACDPAVRVTRSFLGWGVVAGPFYVVVALVQALFLRPGFDLSRDDVSLLSNGQLGWIQVANFVLTGLMVLACAIGAGRALAGGRGATWGPRLLALYGLGLIAAGIFTADPMNGFPAGAPAGRPDSISTHGILHIVAAAVGFLGLIASCFVMARRFAAEHRRGWMGFSIATGIAFLAGFVGVASGSGSPLVVIAFWAALIVAWTWIAGISLHLYRRAGVA